MANQEQQNEQTQQFSLEHLIAEKNDLEHTHPLAAKLLENEITRIQSGAVENMTFIELHQPKTKVEFRVRIPQKEFPQVNFVGKILGQGGETVRQLQEATNVRIAVLGRGSMKDKAKQEELRKQGGKYAHLNHDLHVWFEAIGHPIDCYQRIVHAFQLVHPYLTPDPNETGEGQANGAAAAGRGMMHGGAMSRGAMRGAAPRGAMGAAARGAMGPMARGAPAARGGVPASRGALMAGAMMGGAVRPPMRGSPAARGVRGSPMSAAARGAARGTGLGARGAASARGVAPVRGAAAGRGRGMSAAVAASSMMQAQAAYPTESYEYEVQAASMYGGGYGEEMASGYEDQMAMADNSYSGAGADNSDAYQYEAYGQVDASGGYGGYGEVGWAGDGSDGSGYGKVPTPTRGGLNAYRSRPY